MKRKCPTCNSSNGIRIIIWGMPAGPPDESKYYIGGCLLDDHMPDYKCITCGWEGFKRSGKTVSFFQGDSSQKCVDPS